MNRASADARRLGEASEPPMITQLIFQWAEQTPERTAVIYNGKARSYRSFARAIAVARSYFARRGYLGPGYAVLTVSNTMIFWIFSLALRSLGLTTVCVNSPAILRKLGSGPRRRNFATDHRASMRNCTTPLSLATAIRDQF